MDKNNSDNLFINENKKEVYDFDIFYQMSKKEKAKIIIVDLVAYYIIHLFVYGISELIYYVLINKK